MRTVVHLSDLHFGRVNHSMIEPLVALLADLAPDLIAVSGDLTQRARTGQFIEARSFLDRLPKPQVVVPGNHDVPLYSVFRRFAQPLKKFRRYITDDLAPFYADNEIAVIGINTARSLTIKGGNINESQLALIRDRLCEIGGQIIKIVVTHHPFDLPPGNLESDIVGSAPLAMRTLAECGVDILLAGHMHFIHTGHTAARYNTPDHSALVIQAGTAISTRHRGEPNSFNVVRTEGMSIKIARMVWHPKTQKYIASTEEAFRRKGAIWMPV